jgi:hypothetical protein
MKSILLTRLMTLVLLSGCASNAATPVSVDESEPLHGTVVLRDDQGASHVPREGTMRVYLSPWTGDAGFETVRIDDGKWACSRPCEHRGYAIGRMVLDGHDAYSQEDVFEYQGQRFIALEAERLKPAFVHVIDRHTGADISSVKLSEVVTYAENRRAPGAVIVAGSGRFALDAWCTWPFPGAYKEGREFWIDATGYEPRVQFLNPWDGGDWKVELEPSLDH